MRRPRRPSHIEGRVAVGAAIVVVPAVSLWTRQTPEAQLRVDSFGGAVAEVAFWSVPTVVCVMLFRRRTTIVVSGLGATAVLTAVWSGSARDWHSTASWRPALIGWFVLPVALLIVRFAEGRFGAAPGRAALPVLLADPLPRVGGADALPLIS